MRRVSDIVSDFISSIGVRHIFMVTGGGAMHLNDAFGKNKEIKCIFHHHEQACAIAAEGYARSKGDLAVVNVTTGPGGLNALTGLMGQWTDSVPVLYISGQVKYETTIGGCPDVNLRQLGDQEVDIVNVVKPLTKYATTITNPNKILEELQKAVHIAISGRPGPVWIDIPMNIQGAMVDEDKLVGYVKQNSSNLSISNNTTLCEQVNSVLQDIYNAKRPVFIAGQGIKISKSKELFLEVAEKLGVPILTTFNGIDVCASDHPLFIGRIGTIGNRSANFVLQNADLIISIGSRNNVRQISYNWELFGRSAKKIVVDIDNAELLKPTLKPDVGICADAAEFLEILNNQIDNEKTNNFSDWLEWGRKRKKRFPAFVDSKNGNDEKVDPYRFCNEFSNIIPKNSVIVIGNATPSVAYLQTGIIKKGHTVIWNSGCASMGYALPASIGAQVCDESKVVFCLTGEGSLQMNIQELQTIVHYKLPIKIFLFNNNGYSSIKQTQDSFFNGNRTGVNAQTGVSFPNTRKIAVAYGIEYKKIEDNKSIKNVIDDCMNISSPLICELFLPEEYIFQPKLSSEKKPDGRIISKPLEDMYPFLDREEFRKNMIVPEWKSE